MKWYWSFIYFKGFIICIKTVYMIWNWSFFFWIFVFLSFFCFLWVCSYDRKQVGKCTVAWAGFKIITIMNKIMTCFVLMHTYYIPVMYIFQTSTSLSATAKALAPYEMTSTPSPTPHTTGRESEADIRVDSTESSLESIDSTTMIVATVSISVQGKKQHKLLHFCKLMHNGLTLFLLRSKEKTIGAGVSRVCVCGGGANGGGKDRKSVYSTKTRYFQYKTER